MTALAGPTLRGTGWRGGQWVQYVTPTGVDDFVVEASDGNLATGFLIFPSEGYAEQSDWGAVGNYTGVVLRSENGSGNSTVTFMAGSYNFV